MEVVQVQGTDMDPSHYDPRDWTQVLRAQAKLRETRNATHGTNADPSVRETPSQSRETPQTATTPGLHSSSTQLRVLHTTAQKIKQLAPLPPDGYKVVFRSQGGLDLTTLQPRYLLTALMQAAALTDPSTLTLRIHPVNNTCTVSAVNQEDALKLVQLQHITYDQHEYAMTAYIAPPDGSVRGVITNAYWKESPQELLADLISRNPRETILDARRMGLTRSILITFGQATVPRKIVYGGGLHLCTPYTPRVETCSNCRTIGHRTDVCIQPRTHKCPRCGQLHPKEATPTCIPVCIICEGPHLSGTRECKHRHLPKVTRPTSPREPRSQERVDNSLRGASTKRSEPPAGQRKGQSKSSDQPTWADKLKTPKGTRPPATNAPPAPDPRDQELRALRVESQRGLNDEVPATYSKRLVCLVVFAVAAILVIVVAGLFYVSAMVAQMSARNGDGSEGRVSLSCRTDGCARFEALLADTLNTSVDPCHDFKAYVSSRWLPDPSKQLDYHWRYEWDVKYAWMRMMADEIRLRHRTSPLERLMADSFGACAHRAKENASETRKKFKELMRDLGVPWPEKPPINVDPFEAHLNMSIRWNVPLWFDVKMLPDDTLGDLKVIYIYPSAYAKFWKGQYLAIIGQGSMRRYVDQYLAYFYPESTPNAGGKAADICQYDAVFNFTRRVVSRLADVVAKNKSVAVLGFNSLAQAFGQKTERLVSLMNEYFLPGNFSSFEPEDRAIVKAPDTLDVVRHIIADTDASTVLSHLGWWMLQVYAPVADNHFFVQKYGSEENTELLRPLFCETQVETSFKLLLLVSHMAVYFRSRQQRGIHDLLTSVREAAVAEYEKSDLPDNAKTLLTRMVRRLHVNLWPKPEYRSVGLLRRIYSFKYASKKTMLDYWISERRGNAALIGGSAYFEDKRLPHGNSKDPFSFDSILDTVSLSMVAVHEPFYYRDDDAFGAINYGGLGAGFAKTLLEGLESDSVLRAAIASDASSGAVDGNETLPWGGAIGNDTTGSPRPELGLVGPVFLPAFRAFQAKMHGGGPVNAGPFSPAKVFFVNFCHSQTRMSASFDCNAALRGAPDFVSAFGCKRGSNMNP
ncbi:hypothetical protein HPB52_009768 [Rhipicephalus sanguineus]|uniref:Peptidase M13 N-terminal domain-containing protein n=1 Tax=Rhipicephalus sanguineus TaxID=34632 RepID=A0A9D4QAR5_RHISA|nr:hypothetical protein HPB52_009768 [Rhipicephalus sanguineus]